MSTTEHTTEQGNATVVRSLVPARMDRLPWTRFHWLVVVGLGVSWILDGLEIQIVSLISPILGKPQTLHLTPGQIGFLGSGYLIGEVVGALFFGRLTDKLGRKRLFIATLAIYLVGSGLGGFAWNYWSLLVLPLRRRHRYRRRVHRHQLRDRRADPVQVPRPHRHRGQRHLLGRCGDRRRPWACTCSTPATSRSNWGWRIGFFIGPVLGLIIIFLRRTIPESPRWLMTHGRNDEAERTVDDIEARVKHGGRELEPVDESKALEVTEHPRLSFVTLTRVFFGEYPRRSIYGFTMMVTQAFLYNAIFFSYGLVLTVFYKVPSGSLPYYFFPFAIGNLLGPLLLGHFFDTIGRRKMILGTYGLSGILLIITAWMFNAGMLSAATQTTFWCVIFFFASAGASSAYLTVSEIFPLELRGQAISYFFAISQGAGGVVAPWLFGHLIGGANNKHVHTGPLTIGYLIGAAIMIIGGLVAWFIGVDSERKSLEDIASPLSAAKRPEGGVTPSAVTA